MNPNPIIGILKKTQYKHKRQRAEVHVMTKTETGGEQLKVKNAKAHWKSPKTLKRQGKALP